MYDFGQGGFASEYVGAFEKQFDLGFDYGYSGETLEPVEKVTVNGKSVDFSVDGGTLKLNRSDITGIKSGDTLTITAVYKNGASSTIEKTAKNYSLAYRLNLAKNSVIILGDFFNQATIPGEDEYKLLKKRIAEGYYDRMDSRDRELVKADANEDGAIDERDLKAFREYIENADN